MNLTEKLTLWLVLERKIEKAREEILEAGQSYTNGRRTLEAMGPGKERTELASALSKMDESMKKPREEHHELIMKLKKLDEEIDKFIEDL